MGMDLYAGTMTRYYGQNWETVNQQWAEANGIEYRRFTPEGEVLPQEEINPEEVQADMVNWQGQILKALSRLEERWPENNEAPYYTDKPDWDALGAMLLVAACHTYGEPVPATVEKNWEFMEHPLIARLSEDEARIWSLFRGATCWIPLADSFYFQGPLPNGNQAIIGTVSCLCQELEQLNAMAWQADEDTILSWTHTEGYPIDVETGADGKPLFTQQPPHTQYDTQSLAKYAFSIFWQAMRFAQTQKVPVLMDY